MIRPHAKPIDKFFLGIVIVLLGIGLVFFISASFGILATNVPKFYSVLIDQCALGLVGGAILFFIGLRINYKILPRIAFPVFIASIILTALVFVPHIGFSHGGARRWINLRITTFQPVEVLKIAFIVYLATWLSWIKHKVEDIKFGIIPLVILLGIIALVLFKQPDTKSFILILIAGVSMLFVSGVPLKYLFGIAALGLVVLVVLASATPYLRSRIETFINPAQDPTGSSYQVQQSLIALGSGEVFGRGVGQSIQKFGYLPEPQGDSIFAIIGEEVGFAGTLVVILLYIAFCLRGLRIAYRAPDPFSRLLITGLVILITAQSFMNIAAISGVFPLTGVPLVFMSQGGTSLALSLGVIGLILNISRFQKGNQSRL